MLMISQGGDLTHTVSWALSLDVPGSDSQAGGKKKHPFGNK